MKHLAEYVRELSWTIYFLIILILLSAFVFTSEGQVSYVRIALSSLIIAIPWLICIINSLKASSNTSGLWTFFLIFFGLITIPVYLILSRKVESG